MKGTTPRYSDKLPWSPPERLARFKEFVDVLSTVLNGEAFERTSMRTEHYAAVEAPSTPGTQQRPLPLTIAAGGRTGLAVAAHHGRRWVTIGPTGTGSRTPTSILEAVRRQVGILEELCETLRRETPSKVLLWTPTDPVVESADQFDELAAPYAELGFDEIVLHHPDQTGPYGGDIRAFERNRGPALLNGSRRRQGGGERGPVRFGLHPFHAEIGCPDPGRRFEQRCCDVVDPVRIEHGYLLGHQGTVAARRVDQTDDAGPTEDRHGEVAVLTLRRRRVRLQAVAQTEEPFEAVAEPNEAVEGREQETPPSSSGPERIKGGGSKVGSGSPSLDRDGSQAGVARSRRARRAAADRDKRPGRRPWRRQGPTAAVATRRPAHSSSLQSCARRSAGMARSAKSYTRWKPRR